MFNPTVKDSAKAILDLCELLNCSLEEAWEKYTHPVITEQFKFEDIQKYIEENYKGKESILVPRYVLRWQKGIAQENIKVYYTYGSRNNLLEKAKVLVNDESILFVSLDKVDIVFKDVRSEKMLEMLEGRVIE